ncbi:dienelactone hydrolase family protein [Roseateles asaccharophilus]|uniref:Carboxymethylenebutenolidase n=1 Tax=Roseateles asaccharophilus TaxID=582607 RepID=A0ABU2A502_9BURK|nr:dienelactone hydrolase family protein [Roseateles asaccharophilus]MDR7332090.1 carboxymethylenebutenolidase [Roseateles asaccharophilus]
MTNPNDIPEQAWPLFDRYVHGDLSRRGFLDQAAKFTGGPAGAAALLAALSPNFAAAQQVKPDDARLVTRRQSFPSPDGNGQVQGYLAKPASATGKLPAVLVVHENRGLNPHIEDVTRRVALAGYVAYAPDALAPLGGYPGTEDKARELFGKLDPAKARADIVAGARGLLTLADGNGKLGVVGFCWGGALSSHVATQVPELAVAVPFYGGAPAAEDVPRIKARLLIHYAANDERVNASWPGYEAALKAAGVRYEAHIYPGTQHGFNNDTTPRYDAAAATLAWDRTLAAFKSALG